jgi:hypothetical protein
VTIGSVHLTSNYARFRVRNPWTFTPSSFRTIGIGSNQRFKAVVGHLKTGKRKTKVQTVLIPRSDYAKGWSVQLNKHTRSFVITKGRARK